MRRSLTPGRLKIGTTAPKHGGDVLDLYLGGVQLLVGHGTIAGAKINRARGHLANPAAAANGLVVDLDPGMGRAVLAEPLGINRIRKGRTRSIELLRVTGSTPGRSLVRLITK